MPAKIFAALLALTLAVFPGLSPAAQSVKTSASRAARTAAPALPVPANPAFVKLRLAFQNLAEQNTFPPDLARELSRRTPRSVLLQSLEVLTRYDRLRIKESRELAIQAMEILDRLPEKEKMSAVIEMSRAMETVFTELEREGNGSRISNSQEAAGQTVEKTKQNPDFSGLSGRFPEISAFPGRHRAGRLQYDPAKNRPWTNGKEVPRMGRTVSQRPENPAVWGLVWLPALLLYAAPESRLSHPALFASAGTFLLLAASLARAKISAPSRFWSSLTFAGGAAGALAALSLKNGGVLTGNLGWLVLAAGILSAEIAVNPSALSLQSYRGILKKLPGSLLPKSTPRALPGTMPKLWLPLSAAVLTIFSAQILYALLGFEAQSGLLTHQIRILVGSLGLLWMALEWRQRAPDWNLRQIVKSAYALLKKAALWIFPFVLWGLFTQSQDPVPAVIAQLGGFQKTLLLMPFIVAFEETVFRLGLFAGLLQISRKRIGPSHRSFYFAAILSSSLFAGMHLFHLGLPLSIGVAVFAYFKALSYYETGSLAVPFTAHLMVNIPAVLVRLLAQLLGLGGLW
ncbi:MAG: CPBP family intramembrane metalloprotease [Elusimicrobia bacterium]|nr:CPBP family intramembrane metalloprotease [Elusimicrobiota bacterium]